MVLKRLINCFENVTGRFCLLYSLDFVFILGIPILNIESIPTKTTSTENNEGSGREDSQPQSGAPAIPLWQNGPVEQTTPFGAMGQPEANDPNGPNVMLGSPESGVFPVLLVKPTVSQSDGTSITNVITSTTYALFYGAFSLSVRLDELDI